MQLEHQRAGAPDQLVLRFLIRFKTQRLHDRNDLLILCKADQHVRIAHRPQFRLGVQRLDDAALEGHVVDPICIKRGKDPLQLPHLTPADLHGLAIVLKELLHGRRLRIDAAARCSLINHRSDMVRAGQTDGLPQVKALWQRDFFAGDGSFQQRNNALLGQIHPYHSKPAISASWICQRVYYSAEPSAVSTQRAAEASGSLGQQGGLGAA